MNLGTRVIIFLTDPQDIKIILNSPEHIDKPIEYRFFKPCFKDSMLVNNGAKWLKQRNTILATFRMQTQKTYVPVFYENSLDLVRQFGDKIGSRFNCHNYLSAVTINMFVEAVLGVSKEKFQNVYEHATAMMKLSDIVHKRQLNVSL